MWVETEIPGYYTDLSTERYSWSDCMAGKKKPFPFPPKKGKPGSKMPMKGAPMKGAKCAVDDDATYLRMVGYEHFKCLMEIPLHSELCLVR